MMRLEVGDRDVHLDGQVQEMEARYLPKSDNLKTVNSLAEGQRFESAETIEV